MPTPATTQRTTRPLPDHEPTPTDFMLRHHWSAEPALKRAPLPMLPMPPIPRAARKVRRPSLALLQALPRAARTTAPRHGVWRRSLRTRIAALAASTLLCGALLASAVLWVTHHHSALAQSATLALQQITPSA